MGHVFSESLNERITAVPPEGQQARCTAALSPNPSERVVTLRGIPWCDQLLRVVPQGVSSTSKRVKPEGWLNNCQASWSGPELRCPISAAFPALMATKNVAGVLPARYPRA